MTLPHLVTKKIWKCLLRTFVDKFKGWQFTLEAVRMGGSPLSQYGQNHFVPEHQFPYHTVSTAVFPCTSWAWPQGKLLQNHWIPEHQMNRSRQKHTDQKALLLTALKWAWTWDLMFHLFSRISGSVMRVLVMWLWTPLRPVQPGPAPAPPATVS